MYDYSSHQPLLNSKRIFYKRLGCCQKVRLWCSGCLVAWFDDWCLMWLLGWFLVVDGSFFRCQWMKTQTLWDENTGWLGSLQHKKERKRETETWAVSEISPYLPHIALLPPFSFCKALKKSHNRRKNSIFLFFLLILTQCNTTLLLCNSTAGSDDSQLW